MSPGSSRRDRTTASTGAFSSPNSIWWRSNASCARDALTCASAPAMSSEREPDSTRRSASRSSSVRDDAVTTALCARSRSCRLTPRPCVFAAMPCSRARSSVARATSACAVASRLRASWISSGRAPFRRRRRFCSCASICAVAWSIWSANVRVSMVARTAPARTWSPSSARTSAIRPLPSNASDTCLMSTLPCQFNPSGSITYEVG